MDGTLLVQSKNPALANISNVEVLLYMMYMYIHTHYEHVYTKKSQTTEKP